MIREQGLLGAPQEVTSEHSTASDRQCCVRQPTVSESSYSNSQNKPEHPLEDLS